MLYNLEYEKCGRANNSVLVVEEAWVLVLSPHLNKDAFYLIEPPFLPSVKWCLSLPCLSYRVESSERMHVGKCLLNYSALHKWRNDYKWRYVYM